MPLQWNATCKNYEIGECGTGPCIDRSTTPAPETTTPAPTTVPPCARNTTTTTPGPPDDDEPFWKPSTVAPVVTTTPPAASNTAYARSHRLNLVAARARRRERIAPATWTPAVAATWASGPPGAHAVRAAARVFGSAFACLTARRTTAPTAQKPSLAMRTWPA